MQLRLSCLHITYTLCTQNWLSDVTAVIALQVQNTYLPVVLGVEYGLLVVLAILATFLLVLERPRTGGFFLLLYWIWLVPVMFTGPGARLMLALLDAAIVSRVTRRCPVHIRLPRS